MNFIMTELDFKLDEEVIKLMSSNQMEVTRICSSILLRKVKMSTNKRQFKVHFVFQNTSCQDNQIGNSIGLGDED